MRIDGSGDVGIGTSSIDSSYKLNVEGAVIPILAKSSSTSTSPRYACVATARPSNVVGSGSGYGMNMNNSSGNMTEYGYIGGLIESNTAGSQSGALVFAPTSSGTRTERMRIDSSGNVGIGTASPNTYGLGIGRIVTSYVSSGTQYALFSAVGSGTGGGEIDFGNHTVRHAAVASLNGSVLAFYTNGANSGSGVSERMRIDSSGLVLAGVTSSTYHTFSLSNSLNYAAGVVNSNASNPYGLVISLSGVSSGAGAGFLTCVDGNANRLLIRGDGDVENVNNSYGAISDERLKSDIVDASSQIDDIMAVQVRSYTLNETGDTHIGVVAQELEASGMSGLVKTDDEGMKSVKYSILYMKAIKALQEAVTRIETLEAEVMALKGE
jgi:hypothetical protein